MAARWHKLARPEQIFFNEPWIRTDIFMAGRGSGKSRSAAEKLAEDCLCRPGLKAAILAPSYTAGWDTCLFGAKSGLLTLIPDSSLYQTKEKKYLVEFANGSSIRVFSSEQQTHMRGPEFHELWVDEMADLAHGMRAWKVIRPAIRLRHEDDLPARVLVTGTPEAKEDRKSVV